MNTKIPIFKLNNKIKITNTKPVSLVFNYSSIQLTEPMSSLLNKGLNFSILPLKLDITQILVDFRKYERRVIWHEFWFGREADQECNSEMGEQGHYVQKLSF